VIVLPPSALDDRFSRPSDGQYVLSAPDGLNTDLVLDHVRRERHQLYAELTVYCGLSGIQTFNSILFNATINLSSLRERDVIARSLAERTHSAAIDVKRWRTLVDELAIRTQHAERIGTPAVVLRDVNRRTDSRFLRAFRFPLPESAPAMIFSDGDMLKTMTADAIAVVLARQGINVAIVDWEMTEAEHAERVWRISAGNVPDNIVYLNCARPLVYERDRVAETIQTHQSQYVIYDSAAFGCHDKPESADAALAYFREVRRLGTGSLHIAHTTKGEGSDQKPFGSTFWFNSVRALWYAKRAEASSDPAVTEVGFYPRKFNFGAKPQSLALRFTFTDTTTAVEPFDVTDVESLATGLSLRDRIKHALQGGSRTIPELATDLDADPNSVRRAIDRYAGKAKVVLFTKMPGTDGEQRVGLADWRASA
jgi:hypothetical protein